ncbi:GNAT family N-acetyltransferase [Rhizobium glycinendophyticum]|uniref:GNAT family N-acetyltransferase n=1 Tax=Rhizobium glycinendophyticum TaxID=2589807 RepID=A0A504UKH3_9HYPH|nr:GNAT family N-acetyltransferase [Rhizobium glycinendophyticum]TPP05892.1 GNAT family N-acetyltransferase [Rhizobium glycinendophyticum]
MTKALVRRAAFMTLKIHVEEPLALNAELTSNLASLAFQKDGPALSAQRFAWTYTRGYDDVKVVSAFSDGSKIGQLGCLFKTFVLNDRECTAAELVDLFVSPDYRSTKVASLLYKEMKTIVAQKDAQLIFAYANAGASVLNRRHFRMDEATSLPVRLGLAPPLSFLRPGRLVSVRNDIEGVAQACIQCASPEASGIRLSLEQMKRRISSPVYRYLCATDGEVAILASPRIIRSVPLLLICATFAPARVGSSRSIRHLVHSLCRATSQSAYLYVGWNDAIGQGPGLGMPERLLKDKFVIQSNFLAQNRNRIERFELLDVDYG